MQFIKKEIEVKVRLLCHVFARRLRPSQHPRFLNQYITKEYKVRDLQDLGETVLVELDNKNRDIVAHQIIVTQVIVV